MELISGMTGCRDSVIFPLCVSLSPFLSPAFLGILGSYVLQKISCLHVAFGGVEGRGRV